MIASNKDALRLIAAVFVLSLFAAPAGFAQDAQPSAAAPVSILPQNLTPTSAPEEPAAESDAIAVGELAAPAPERAGLVDVSKGGFPATLWSGTDPETLKQLLPQVPHHMASRAQRKIAENLLLSPGTPPSGPVMANASEAAVPPVAASWLLEARVQALGAIGDWSDALALLELVPADQMTDALSRLRTNGQFVTDKVSAACGDVQAALKTSTDTYWQKAQVFCQLVADQASAASIGLGVLREEKIDDPAFFWLADMMQGNKPIAPQNLTALTPLHIAMLRNASGALPESLLKGNDPTTLGALAAIPLADPDANPADKTPVAEKRARQRIAVEARIMLAERAVAAGTLKVEVLRSLYRQWDAKIDPNPPSIAKITAEDVRGRALLFQSAQVQTVPTARAEVITRAIALARADRGEHGPDLTVVGQVYAPLLAEVEPAADLVWFAGDAARALLAAGEEEKAKMWLDLARNMARSSSDAALVADGLWSVEQLMPGTTHRFSSRGLQAWAATLTDESAADRRANAVNLLVAVGEHLTTADLQSLTGNLSASEAAPTISPAVWNGLAITARGKNVGQAALLSLVALGEDGPGRASFATVQRVIETLVAVGREYDARALALEAALVQGL